MRTTMVMTDLEGQLAASCGLGCGCTGALGLLGECIECCLERGLLVLPASDTMVTAQQQLNSRVSACATQGCV